MLDSNADLRPGRFRHRLTRLGIHFLFVATFAMVGGSIRGFNLLIVLAGFLVGALIVQWRTSRRAIELLTVSRELPAEAFADTPFKIRYRVRNLSRWLSVWMIRIDDKLEISSDDTQARISCAVGAVGANRTQATHCHCMVARRGRYRLGPASLTTAFPFALIASSSHSSAAGDDSLYVYPKLLNLTPDWKRRLISRHGGMSTTISRNGAQGDEFFGLREWQSGDTPRQIHWRTSARIDNLAVRQFEQERLFDLCILVDGFVPSTDSHESDTVNVENAISLAATLFTQLAPTQSNRIVVASAGSTSLAIGNATAAGKRHRVLKQLAELQTSESPDIVGAVRSAMAIGGTSQDLVIVSPRSFADASAQLASDGISLRELLSPWARRRTFRWIDVSDDATAQWIGKPIGPQRLHFGPRTENSRAGISKTGISKTGTSKIGFSKNGDRHTGQVAGAGT